MPQGWINCINRGQAATKLFPWFALVHATFGVAEMVPAGIRVVTGTSEAIRQAVSVLERGSEQHIGKAMKTHSVKVSPAVGHNLSRRSKRGETRESRYEPVGLPSYISFETSSKRVLTEGRTALA